MSKKINKETALQYFNELINCGGWGLEEFEKKAALENDENFQQIEFEVWQKIQQEKANLPEKRLESLAGKIKRDLEEECEFNEDEDEKLDESLSFDDIAKKLITEREYDYYDHDNVVFSQRVSFNDMNDEYCGNPKEITIDSVIKKLEKIKSKYPNQEIFLNSFADGTMAVDRISIHVVTKKRKPLYEVYSRIYNFIKYEQQQHEYDITAFERKKKELGL